jgi:hypothetical protein
MVAQAMRPYGSVSKALGLPDRLELPGPVIPQCLAGVNRLPHDAGLSYKVLGMETRSPVTGPSG